MLSINTQLINQESGQKIRFLLAIEDSKGTRIVNLDKEIYSIGRSQKNSLVLHSPLVSRYHATIIRTNNQFEIVDGDLEGNLSANGILVNGIRTASHILQDNDLIIFGVNAKARFIKTSEKLSDDSTLMRVSAITGDRAPVLESKVDCFSTLVIEDENVENNAAFQRVACFPEFLPIPIVEITLEEKITYLNPAAVMKFPELEKTALKNTVLAGLINAVQSEGKSCFIREVEVDGAIFEQSVNYIAETGAIVTYLVDITERKRTELALRESEERYALAAKAANDGLWDWNIKTNEIYFSSRWKSMLGFEENEIGNSADEWLNRVYAEDIDRLKLELIAPLEKITSEFKSEYRILHKDGTYRWMQSQGIAVKDREGNIYRMVGSQTDITARKQAEAQLFHDAFHDVLTGLPNRALLIDRIGNALERAKRREDYFFAVLFLDLDRFKVINDSLGHQSGDLLLKAVVERLVNEVRSGDTVARLGGDEFVILLEDIQTIKDIFEIPDRMQKQLQLPFTIKGQEVFTSASIGIALSKCNYNEPEELQQRC